MALLVETEKYRFFDMLNLAESKIPTYRRNWSPENMESEVNTQSKAKGFFSILTYYRKVAGSHHEHGTSSYLSRSFLRLHIKCDTMWKSKEF